MMEVKRLYKDVVKPLKLNHDWAQYSFKFENETTLKGGIKIYDLKAIIENIK